MYRFSFEKLEVWNQSRNLIIRLYGITCKFPESEKYGLVAQIRRSEVSIASNIAEGSTRTTGKSQANFTQIAFSSLMELLNQLIIAQNLGIFPKEEMDKIRSSIEEIANKLNSLRKYQLNN